MLYCWLSVCQNTISFNFTLSKVNSHSPYTLLTVHFTSSVCSVQSHLQEHMGVFGDREHLAQMPLMCVCDTYRVWSIHVRSGCLRDREHLLPWEVAHHWAASCDNLPPSPPIGRRTAVVHWALSPQFILLISLNSWCEELRTANVQYTSMECSDCVESKWMMVLDKWGALFLATF